jgi:hypothetical protein
MEVEEREHTRDEGHSVSELDLRRGGSLSGMAAEELDAAIDRAAWRPTLLDASPAATVSGHFGFS